MPLRSVNDLSGCSAETQDSLPFHGTGLKFGAVYAVGIETAAARLPLLLGPLLAALRAGRPCALITRLNPEHGPLADALVHARELVEAHGADRLEVFTAVGDYDVNLLLHGAERYLQELDQFELAPGSLLLIDEADDLYTSHDHGALVHQAKAYQAWCERHQHTMIQLHLRTSAHRPLLEGNQAAAQYLSGIARVTSQPGGLQMTIDFWESPAGTRTGIVMPLDLLWPSMKSSTVMSGAGIGAPTGATPPPVGAAPALPCMWCVGAPDDDVNRWRKHFEVRSASTLAEMLVWRRDAQSERLSIVVALGSLAQFAGFVEQLAQLRATVGQRARIVVCESRYRLREYTQKRRLLRAGVDAVLPPSQSSQELITLLLQPRVEPVVVIGEADGNRFQLGGLEAQKGDATGWLSRIAFVDEVERRLRRDRVSMVPHALVEVESEDLLAADAQHPPNAAPRTCRTGDLITATRGAQFFYLQGCRGSDAVHAATRCLGDALANRVQRLHVYTGGQAIVVRLLRLRQEAGAEMLLVNGSQGRSGGNGAMTSAASRADAPRNQVGIASAAALLVALVWPFADARAQSDAQEHSHASPAAVEVAALAYERGDYTEAARRGLIELQGEPGNHELRFVVANSLAWSGQYREALQQYGLLADTPHARAASIGSANVYVWSGRPHLADPLFRRVLSVEPDNVDAQQGLASAQRQLRPRSTVRGESLDDSTRAERSSVMLAHRWRDAGLTQIFEVAGERIDESRSPAGPDLRPRKASFGYQNLGLPLTPKLVLSADSGIRSAVFGNLALHGADDAVSVEIGRVNWGEVAFDPSARSAGLAAARVAAAGRVDTSIGDFSASAVHFAVTDGNRVAEANAQYTPAWQPFATASGLRAFVGVYGRKAQRHDPRYWSPASGYYIGQVGLSLNQSTADWDFSAEARRSQRIGREGAQGWTAGLAGTRWLNRDWAVRFEGLYIETRRDSSAYRSKSIALSVDHVW